MSDLSITLILSILYHNYLQVKGWPRDVPKKPNENIMHPFSTDGKTTIQNRKRAIRIQMRHLSGDTS